MVKYIEMTQVSERAEVKAEKTKKERALPRDCGTAIQRHK